MIYAGLVGLDRHALADELALLRATPEQRPLLEKLLGNVAAGVAVMLLCGLAVVARPAEAAGRAIRTAAMYIRCLAGTCLA